MLCVCAEFPTSKLEMTAVADIFDRDGDGYIDYYEFVAALHPNKDAYRPTTDADKIEDEVRKITKVNYKHRVTNMNSWRCFWSDIETMRGRSSQPLCGQNAVTDVLFVVMQVTRQVAQCKCAKRFQVEQIGENKYRVSSAQCLATD